MSIFENLPYNNYHDLNADWIIEELKKMNDDLQEYKQETDARLDAIEARLDALENGGV